MNCEPPALMRVRRRMRHDRGATLTDILVGLMILSLAASGIFAGHKAALAAWITAQQFAGEQHNVRLVLDWTVRRVRGAGTGYADTPIRKASASEIVFIGDADGDGQVECYRIYLNTGEGVVYAGRIEPLPPDLNLCTTVVGNPITANVEARSLVVTSLDIAYYDGGSGPGNPLTPPVGSAALPSIRRVVITIQAQGLQSPGTFAMSSQAVIRQ